MAAARTTERPAAFDSELRKLAIVVVAGTMMSILDTTIVNVAITPLGRDLHASLSTIQWVLTGYTLALSMAITVTGWAVERFGAKTTWITALLVFITGSVLAGAAWNVTALIVFRVLQGIGGGLIMPVGQTMLARKAGPDRMAHVMSAIAVPAMLGPALGPVLGGLIVNDLSWRWMFYVNVPLCALALVLAVRMLPPDDERSPATIDGPGLALLAPGVACCVYGLSKFGTDNRQSLLWLAAGTFCMAIFVVRARRIAAPLVSVRAFTRRAFRMSTATMVIYSGAFFGFMVVLPVYSQVVRGESPLRAGLLLAPIGLGAAITMPLSGRLADRVAARWIIIAGTVVVAAAAVVFTQIHVGTSLVLVAVTLFVAGLGHGVVLPPAMGAAYQDMPRPEIPAATATFNVVARVGSSAGTAVLAVVLQQSISRHVHSSVTGRGLSGVTGRGLSGVGGGGLSGAARLHGTRAVAELTSAFGVSFWWVAVIAASAAIPALFIPPLFFPALFIPARRSCRRAGRRHT